jgi:hypothetical protein
MRKLIVFVVSGVFATVLFAASLYGAPTVFSLSDATLMTFDDTYVAPYPGFADLVAKTDVAGLGVEYDVTLYGAWGIEIGIGGPSPQADLSAYTDYFLTFANTSADDTFSANLYVKTGSSETYYGSSWVTLFPGMSWELTFDLSGVGNLNDVRELGFGLSAWKGSAFGYADAIQVKVADPPGGTVLDPPNSPVPEASTLMLFGSGLVGLLAIARRKLPFLSR